MISCGQSVMINLKFACTLNRAKTLTFKIYLKLIRPISDKWEWRLTRTGSWSSLFSFPPFPHPTQDVEKIGVQNYSLKKRKSFLKGLAVSEMFMMLQGCVFGKRRSWNWICVICFDMFNTFRNLSFYMSLVRILLFHRIFPFEGQCKC